MGRFWSICGLLATLWAATGVVLEAAAADTAAQKPNMIFILTDDQDYQMDSLSYMPLLKKHMIDQGTTFTHHYCTVALCCPARAILWTGRNAHNTNVTDLAPPYGGYPKFVSQGFNDNYLPLWLGEAGYQTYYVGKLFNAHTTKNYNKPCANGWNGSEFLLEPYTYNYFSPGMTRNCQPYQVYNGSYNTDLVANKSFGFLDDAVKAKSPFFLTIAPVAPHAHIDSTGTGPPNPNTQYADLFPNVKVPRKASFNPDVESGASWIKTLPKLNQTEVTDNDNWYRARLQALQSVDEMVDNLFTKLENYNLLNNTYIFYSADNGFHISQHRLAPGKTCGYEEDVNVPLIVRGPGVAKNQTSEAVSAHSDLSPTFISLAGAAQRDGFDGSPIPIHGSGTTGYVKQEHANIEYWSLAAPPEQGLGKVNNTYKSVRLIGKNYNLYYSVWCDNEHELYDMTTDELQMNNLFPQGFTNQSAASSTQSTALAVSDEKLATRLDSLIFVMKSCKADTCRMPWEALMPGSGVSTLTEALDSQYDNFFANEVPRVSFTKCEPGYIISSEGPQFDNWTDPFTVQARDSNWVARGGDPEWAMWT